VQASGGHAGAANEGHHPGASQRHPAQDQNTKIKFLSPFKTSLNLSVDIVTGCFLEKMPIFQKIDT